MAKKRAAAKKRTKTAEREVEKSYANSQVAAKLRRLADALEALIGASFLDGGYAAAQGLVERVFGEIVSGTDIDNWAKDAKTELQEWLQARKLAVPAYRIVATRGQSHAQTFEVECAVPALGLTERGEGRSRRSAEQDAARRMLAGLKANDRPGGPLRA